MDAQTIQVEFYNEVWENTEKGKTQNLKHLGSFEVQTSLLTDGRVYRIAGALYLKDRSYLDVATNTLVMFVSKHTQFNIQGAEKVSLPALSEG